MSIIIDLKSNKISNNIIIKNSKKCIKMKLIKVRTQIYIIKSNVNKISRQIEIKS